MTRECTIEETSRGHGARQFRRAIVAGIFFAVWLIPALGAAAQEGRDGADTVVIRAAEIVAMQARTVPDVLNQVPGVSANGSAVSIQGSYKVKVFLDGRPLNDPTSSFGAVEWGLVSIEDIDAIEIHRGKGSVKYGQDASGGVILITSKKSHTLTGNLKTQAGSQDTWIGNLTLQATSKNFSGGLSAGYESSAGYQINGDRLRRRIGAQLGYAKNETTGIRATMDYIGDRRGFSGYPDFPTPSSRRVGGLTNSSVQMRHGSLVTNSTFVSSHNRNTDPAIALDRLLRVNEFTQTASSEFRSARLGSIGYGGGILSGGASGSAFEDRREYTGSAFAVQTFPKLRLPVTFTTGIRVNYNTAFNSALNPEVKASYEGHGWQASAAYSRSNNTPSFQQRYNESSSTRANPELGMETARNLSFRLSKKWSPGFSTAVGAFHNQLKDRITYVLQSGSGQYVNLGRVTYAGGDASLTWTPATPVSVKPSYSYLIATDVATGLRVTGKARHSATLLVQFRPIRNLASSLTGRYQSRVYRDARNTIAIPGHVLADFQAEYGWKRLTLFAVMENLLNRRYLYSDGLLAPPRVWSVGLTHKL